MPFAGTPLALTCPETTGTSHHFVLKSRLNAKHGSQESLEAEVEWWWTLSICLFLLTTKLNLPWPWRFWHSKSHQMFIFLKLLRKSYILVYIQRTYAHLRKEKRRWSIHQLSSCEQSINGWKNSGGKGAIHKPKSFHIINQIFSKTHTEWKVATKVADILESNDNSEGKEYREEGGSEEIKPATSTASRERKQPFDSSASSLESGSDEECNR